MRTAAAFFCFGAIGAGVIAQAVTLTIALLVMALLFNFSADVRGEL